MKKKVFLLILLGTLFGKSLAQSNKDFWVKRYVSVSYPLKIIKINSWFGYRRDPFTGGKKFHNGIDLESSHDAVAAMFDGIVINLGSNQASGNFLTIQCGDYSICYCHLSRIIAKVGERINAGDVVGITGSTGRATGDHLHITCRYKGKMRNPCKLLEYITTTKEMCIKILAAKGMPTEGEEEFLAYYAEAAMEQQIRYGIPASVTLAQMALESSWGRSELAKINNNYFGIKGSSNTYRCFKNVWDSMEYHSKILMKNRYNICSHFNEDEYHNWLIGIKAGGYAGDPNYISKCEAIIQRYKLYMFDQIAMNL